MPFDVQKYKLKGCQKMLRHYTRYREENKDVNYANTDIDKSKTVENYFVGVDRKDKYAFLKNMVAEYDKLNPPLRKKKDRVMMAGFVFTVPESIANTEKEKEYFEHCYDWAITKFHKRNIVCAEVHRDEIHEYYDKQKHAWVNSRAHMHMGIIPHVRGIGVNCSKFMTRDNLKNWHKDLDNYIYEKMGIHDLTHSVGQKGRDMEELKKESIEAVIKIKENLENEIKRMTKEVDDIQKVIEFEIENLDSGVNRHQEECQKKIEDAERECKERLEAIENEIRKTEIEWNDRKHRMNQEFLDKSKRLSEIKTQINREIQELYNLAIKFELTVFEEKANTVKKEFNRIVDEWER